MARWRPNPSKALGRRLAKPAAPARPKAGPGQVASRSIREIMLEQSLKRAELQLRSLRSLAYFDELCGIHNRRAFNDEIRRVTGMAQRHGGDTAIVIFDVDDMKRINDGHGHAVGDIVLVAVAQAIKTSIRSTDFVARIGGDEFALIMHRIDETAAEAKVTDIQARIASTRIDTTAGHLAVTISAGHSMLCGLADEAIRHADHAMYRSKRVGRTIYQHT